MDEATGPENKEIQATPSYGYHDPKFTLETEEEAGEEFSFSEFFLGKFPIAVLVSGLALSLYTAKGLDNFPMFFGFLIMSTLGLAALPTILAGGIALPAAAIIARVKDRPFKKAFKPVFTLLLFIFWAFFLAASFVRSSHLIEQFD